MRVASAALEKLFISTIRQNALSLLSSTGLHLPEAELQRILRSEQTELEVPAGILLYIFEKVIDLL